LAGPEPVIAELEAASIEVAVDQVINPGEDQNNRDEEDGRYEEAFLSIEHFYQKKNIKVFRFNLFHLFHLDNFFTGAFRHGLSPCGIAYMQIFPFKKNLKLNIYSPPIFG